MKTFARFLFLFVFVGAVALTTGCKTMEPDNASTRPWGYRPGYDPGMPSMLNEGR